jgi:hypothetical protein
MRAAAAIVLAAAAFALGASAQTPAPTSPPTAEDISLHAYGDREKTCQEWTDGCRTCTRSDAGDPTCPNIGIACQPKAISCAKRVEEKK